MGSEILAVDVSRPSRSVYRVLSALAVLAAACAPAAAQSLEADVISSGGAIHDDGSLSIVGQFAIG